MLHENDGTHHDTEILTSPSKSENHTERNEKETMLFWALEASSSMNFSNLLEFGPFPIHKYPLTHSSLILTQKNPLITRQSISPSQMATTTTQALSPFSYSYTLNSNTVTKSKNTPFPSRRRNLNLFLSPPLRYSNNNCSFSFRPKRIISCSSSLKDNDHEETESSSSSSSSSTSTLQEPLNDDVESDDSQKEEGYDSDKKQQQEVDWKTDEEFKKFMGNPSIEAAIKLEKKRADRKLKELDRESSNSNPIVGLFNTLVRDILIREKERLQKAEQTFKALDLNQVNQ